MISLVFPVFNLLLEKNGIMHTIYRIMILPVMRFPAQAARARLDALKQKQAAPVTPATKPGLQSPAPASLSLGRQGSAVSVSSAPSNQKSAPLEERSF